MVAAIDVAGESAALIHATQGLLGPVLIGVMPPEQTLTAKSDEHSHKWLAHRDRRRWHLHFTPTASSWTNLIERWFKELTDRRLRRGTFTSVAELEDAIQLWTSHWNQDPTPFIWKATAADIIEKVQRGRAALNRQINSKTDH